MAIKEISRRILNDKLLESLRQEIEILKSVSNPNIIRLVGVKKSVKNFYLIMEYCNGGDLHKFLKRNKRVDEYVAQSIVHQVANGLRELARNHILHRDLKLSNLLISEHDGEVTIKIADFGFARVLSNSEDAQTFCGTAPNMAPEVLTGYYSHSDNFSMKYNEKADLWSVGTILFQLITGYPPFEGKNPIQVLQNINKGSYSYPADIQVTPVCRSLIQQLLQVEPERRLGWAEFFDHPFVKDEPADYLLALRRQFGDKYGLRDPMEMLRPAREAAAVLVMRKKEHPLLKKTYTDPVVKPHAAAKPTLLPVKEPVVPTPNKALTSNDLMSTYYFVTTYVIEEYDFVEAEEAKVQPDEKINLSKERPALPPLLTEPDESPRDEELAAPDLRKLYRSAVLSVVRQSEVFLQYLQDNKETHAVTFENVEFLLAVNLLTRAQVLLSMSELGPRGRKDENFAVVVRQGDHVTVLDLKRDVVAALHRPMEKDLLLPVMKAYIRLVEYLKTCAFLLQEIDSFASLDRAVDNIIYVVEQVRIEEQLKNSATVRRRLEQCLTMLEIVVEEHCLYAEKARRAFPPEWCRFVRVGSRDRMVSPVHAAEDVRYLVYLRTLLLHKLKSQAVDVN